MWRFGGLSLALSRKRGKEIAFPVALFLTDSLVHALHRPWFDYYYLHLAVPLAGGLAINEVIQDIRRLHAKYRFSLFSLSAWKQWVPLLSERGQQYCHIELINRSRRPPAGTTPSCISSRHFFCGERNCACQKRRHPQGDRRRGKEKQRHEKHNYRRIIFGPLTRAVATAPFMLCQEYANTIDPFTTPFRSRLTCN